MTNFGVVYSMGVVNINNKRFDKAGWSADSCPSPAPIEEIENLTFERAKRFQKGVVRPNGKFVAQAQYTERMFKNDTAN